MKPVNVHQKSLPFPPARLLPPVLRLIVPLLLGIMLAEILITLLTTRVFALAGAAYILTDAAINLLVLLPILYCIAIRPLLAEMRERRHAELAHEEANQRYRELFASSPLGITLSDLGGRVLESNAAMQRFLGYPADELNQLNFRHFTDAQDFSTDAARYADLIAGKISHYHMEKRYRNKEGELRWGYLTVSLITDASGTPRYALRMVEDTTDHRRVQEQLRESDERFRNVLENIQLVGVILDNAGAISFCNAFASTLLGYTREEVLNQDWFDLAVPAEVREHVRTLYRENIHSASVPAHFENEIITRYGERRTILWSNTVLFDGQGAVIGITSIGRDITERKRVEEQLRLSARVIEDTIEGVTITDAQGIIQFVNPAFTAITGYSAEEAIGQNPRILKSDRHDQPFYKTMWQSLVDQGQWQGEIWNRRKNGEAYPEWLTISAIQDDAGQTTQYVAVFNDISEHKANEERIHHQAYHDALTDLPNRLLFDDRLSMGLAHARRNQEMLAVLFLDLDRFKNINDTLGHLVGDELLQAVAGRLCGCVRKVDTVARMGGDEFTLLLPEAKQVEEVVKVAEKILTAFQQPFHIREHEFYISASIGISVYPLDGEDAESLMKNADIAMYRAKAMGRDTYQLYAPDMNARAVERLTLETSLRHALERDEFLLHYQPRVDIATGAVVSMEALIRWRNSVHGLVSPGDFIPLAEETGLIVPIGEWVLRTACAQQMAWQAAGLPPMRVAVNLSARQFVQEDLLEMIARVLIETGLDARYLELEITESTAMEHVQESLSTLRALHQMGITLAIDDFGTGYSSLSYLKQFPVHALKIDRSFVRDITADENNAAIANAVIALSHTLGLTVIAEGVETREQLHLLQQYGCDEVQGFYFSRPLSAEDFRATYLERQQFVGV